MRPARGYVFIPGADDVADDVAKVDEETLHEDVAEVEEETLQEEAPRWRKAEFSEVKMMIESNSYMSWVKSEERQRCLDRMPMSELKRRRMNRPP